MLIFYDLSIYRKYMLKQKVYVSLETHTHLLLTGSSGTGKSYALKFLLLNLLEYNPKIYFCDFKNSDDFRFLSEYSKYFKYVDCIKAIDDFFKQFSYMQENSLEKNNYKHILIFDEYPAFITYLTSVDKKKAEEVKSKVAILLSMGRSYSFCVWLIMQRPDTAFLVNGARDNFHILISLGKLSKEAKNMLYSGENIPNINLQKGEGISYIDGVGLKFVKFPKLKDINLVNETLRVKFRELDNK